MHIYRKDRRVTSSYRVGRHRCLLRRIRTGHAIDPQDGPLMWRREQHLGTLARPVVTSG